MQYGEADNLVPLGEPASKVPQNFIASFRRSVERLIGDRRLPGLALPAGKGIG